VSYSTCKTKLVLNDDKYNFVNKTYDDINKKRLDRIGDSWFGSDSEQKWKKCSDSKKARTHSEIVPEREDHQIEAKKKIKARKWIRK
jgi:hypothetical protein